MSHYNSEQAAQLRDIGHYLQQQRLSHALTLQEIADQTFIRLAVLRSLENGDVDQLPEKVYVQGFIRRYGEILGLDGEELSHTLRDIPDELPIAAPESQKPTRKQEVTASPPVRSQTQTFSPPQPQPKPAKSASVRSSSSYKGIGKIMTILLGLAVIGGVGGYFFTRPSVVETADTKVEASPSASENSNVKVQNSQVNSPASPNVAPSPSPIVQVSPTVAPSPSPSPSPEVPLSLAVQITDRAWLKVTTDGEKAYEGILPAGEQKKWTAKQEIRIETGNAGGVKAGLNNSPLEPLGRPGQVKTANFKAETLQ